MQLLGFLVCLAGGLVVGMIGTVLLLNFGLRSMTEDMKEATERWELAHDTLVDRLEEADSALRKMNDRVHEMRDLLNQNDDIESNMRETMEEFVAYYHRVPGAIQDAFRKALDQARRDADPDADAPWKESL